MRTKNAKRLWPVPATLGVMAVAALLAFGLLAANGAQPAAAQSDDADCELTFNAEATLDAGVHTASPVAELGIPIICDTMGDTATVEVQGPLVAFTAAENLRSVRFYIEDSNGGLSAFAPELDVSWVDDQYELDGTDNPAPITKYRFVKVDIPAVETDPNTGLPKRGSTTFTVEKSKGGRVHIYSGATPNLTGIVDAGTTPDNQERRQLVAAQGTTTITFLGEPALGEDLDTDHNTKLDDVIMLQCVADPDPDSTADDTEAAMSTRLVGEHATDCEAEADEDWLDSTSVTDAPESRSKLVVRTIGDPVGGNEPIHDAAEALIDGGTLEHEISGSNDQVIIYAVVKDEDGEDLLETEVSFSATTVPTGIVAPRDLGDEVDTVPVIVTGTATNENILINDLEGSDTPPTGTIIDAGDAVAAFRIDHLPDGDADSFRVSVEVMVGDLSLGTVVIARTGDATKVVAGVFNAACFDPDETGAEPDYSEATFNAKNKGCDDSGMANHFGHGEMVFVKAHHEDALDLIVPDPTGSLSAELSDEDDNLLGDARVISIADPVMTGDPAQAWVFTIDEDATVGERMITVSTDVEDDEGDELESVMLSVTLAGPPHRYGVEGPMYIPLGGSGAFTVTAMDELGGLPHFTTDTADDNDIVNVFVADVPSGNVRGLASGNNLMLDEDTGMGTFTLYAPRDAGQGEVARIFVSSGDSEVALTVMFGEEPPENVAPMAEGSIADRMVYVGATDMVDVSGAFSDADMDTLTYTAESDMMDYATAEVDDMGMVTITGVAAGMATITVTAMDDGGMSAMQTIDVTVMMPEPMLGPAMNLMATANDDGSITLSWTAGMDANHHFVAGTAGDGYPVWEYSSAMDSHTVSADVLTAGTEYTFYVLSGYWMEQDDGTWDGMWAAAGWSNAAMEAMSGN